MFQGDLQDAMRLIQDPAGLKGIMRSIFEKHAAAALPATTLAEDDLQAVKRSITLLHAAGQGLISANVKVGSTRSAAVIVSCVFQAKRPAQFEPAKLESASPDCAEQDTPREGSNSAGEIEDLVILLEACRALWSWNVENDFKNCDTAN